MDRDRLKRHMFSQERWNVLTKNYPGLNEQPIWLAKDAKHIVDWETEGKTRFEQRHSKERPSERRAAYANAAKKISQAREALASALNMGTAPFEVCPIPDNLSDIDRSQSLNDRSNFLQNTLVHMKVIERGLEHAANNLRAAKTGPNNQTLQIFVWMTCDWFAKNGLGSKISGGEESYSVKFFIKNVFREYGYIPQDRAISDYIRSYQKNPR